MSEHDAKISDEASCEETPEELDAVTIRKMLPGACGATLEDSLRDRCVTRKDMRRFLAEAPPRIIPRSMELQMLGDNRPLMTFLVFATVFLLVLLTLLVFIGKSERKRSSADYVSIVVIPSFPATVAAVIFMYRRRKARILRYGMLTTGTVTEAVRCQWSSSSGQPHWVTIRYQDATGSQTVSLYIYGQPGEVAIRYAESGQDTNVLVDPHNRTRIACPDFLDIFEQEVTAAANKRVRPYKYRPM